MFLKSLRNELLVPAGIALGLGLFGCAPIKPDAAWDLRDKCGETPTATNQSVEYYLKTGDRIGITDFQLKIVQPGEGIIDNGRMVSPAKVGGENGQAELKNTTFGIFASHKYLVETVAAGEWTKTIVRGNCASPFKLPE